MTNSLYCGLCLLQRERLLERRERDWEKVKDKREKGREGKGGKEGVKAGMRKWKREKARANLYGLHGSWNGSS